MDIDKLAEKHEATYHDFNLYNGKHTFLFLRASHKNKCWLSLHNAGVSLIETGTLKPRSKKGARRYMLRFSLNNKRGTT